MKLSVIIPAYNEEESFPKFYPSLLKVIIDTVGKSYEIVMVNDGSSDGTLKLLQDIANQNKKLRVVNFSRNFGKEIAVTAGISYAQGEVIIIDADGQHPPELIPKFVKLWEDGYQVVIGVRESNQKEGLTKRYGSKLFYKLLNVTSDTTLIAGATDFRLIDRAVQAEFIQFSEHYRITRGLIDWMGFRRATIPFHANKRIAGQASYRVSKLIRLALNSFVSLSVAPLYIFGYVGAFITFGAFMVGLFVIIEQLILGDPLGLRVTGTAMLSILTLFLVGILLISQGLISVYLSHVHAQTQNRPLFIVDKQNSIRLT
jgi:dolichol-phosphate mannosyltransferase